MLRSENSALRSRVQKYESEESNFDRFFKVYQSRQPPPQRIT